MMVQHSKLARRFICNPHQLRIEFLTKNGLIFVNDIIVERKVASAEFLLSPSKSKLTVDVALGMVHTVVVDKVVHKVVQKIVAVDEAIPPVASTEHLQLYWQNWMKRRQMK